MSRAARDENAALEFARDFYGWYVLVSKEDGKGPACERALKRRSKVFSAPLASAIGEDLKAQSKIRGQVVGIDFDPFLNTQDPGDRYEVRSCERRGERYFVTVHRVHPVDPGERADVVAELCRIGGKWKFMDFHYPSGGSLLQLLTILRLDRERHEK